ncbi:MULTISPECIES: MarR family winged helix-turn-helix transcriptional regulator [Methanobrevibacter]|jgi:DNA-binding MarR family transcriptional regulator|uniref:MarR family winged helix-turn-helix transcriptional regulator n=1 Tax=Methanobrevibacter TaxID=2172 RepID=UPI0038FD36FC
MKTKKEKEIFKNTFKMNDTIFLIKEIQEEHQHYLKEEIDKYEISYEQLKLLLAIKNNPKVNQKDLSEIYDINESSITRSIRKLEKNQYINRIPNLENHRKKDLILTKKSEETLNSLIKHENNWTTKLKNILTLNEEEQLNTLLKKFNENKTKQINKPKVKTEKILKKPVEKIFGQEYKIIKN